MKKIIISLAMFLGVFSMTLGNAFAAERFNTDPRDLPTVMVTNVTNNAGCTAQPGAGCWRTSTTAKAGDVVAVQVYFHNSTEYLAEDTKLSIKPEVTSRGTNHTFTGGVAATTIDRATGSANISISSAQTLTFIPGTVRLFKNGSTAGYTVSNERSLFGTGLPIGDVSPGMKNQGVVVAQYKVSNNTAPNPNPDPDPVDECKINSFTATDYTIERGDSTTLRWTTTDCDNVKIYPTLGSVPVDGSENVRPTSDTKYTLTATGRYGSDTATLTINVEDKQEEEKDECKINSFTATDYTIERGDSTTLRWTTTDCDNVKIYPTLGSVPVDGSENVRPTSDTKYTLTATGRYGSDTATLTVKVEEDYVPPTKECSISFYAGNTVITKGGTTTLHWNTTGFDSVQILPTLGTRPVDGSAVVAPSVTTTYTLYGYGCGSTQTRSLTVSVVPKQVPYNPPVVVHRPPVVVQNSIDLSISSNTDEVCPVDVVEYEVFYQNSGNASVRNAVLRVELPDEVEYIDSSRGNYSSSRNTVTIDLGTLSAGESGTVTIEAEVLDSAEYGNEVEAQAILEYTGSNNRTDEITSSAFVTVSEDCDVCRDTEGSHLGASAFGLGSFLPDTLLEWLLLILVILALIVLGRQLSKKNEPAAPKA